MEQGVRKLQKVSLIRAFLVGFSAFGALDDEHVHATSSAFEFQSCLIANASVHDLRHGISLARSEA